MEIPDPRYVQTEDGAIAYQVVGDGRVDIAWQADWVSDLDATWEAPWESAWLESLASFARRFCTTGERQGFPVATWRCRTSRPERQICGLCWMPLVRSARFGRVV